VASLFSCTRFFSPPSRFSPPLQLDATCNLENRSPLVLPGLRLVRLYGLFVIDPLLVYIALYSFLSFLPFSPMDRSPANGARRPHYRLLLHGNSFPFGRPTGVSVAVKYFYHFLTFVFLADAVFFFFFSVKTQNLDYPFPPRRARYSCHCHDFVGLLLMFSFLGVCVGFGFWVCSGWRKVVFFLPGCKPLEQNRELVLLKPLHTLLFVLLRVLSLPLLLSVLHQHFSSCVKIPSPFSHINFFLFPLYHDSTK